MILADASSLPVWFSGIAVVIATAGGVLTLFMTRREVESRQAEFDRRMASHEAVHAAVLTQIESTKSAAEAKVNALRGEFNDQLAGIYDKVNRLNTSVASIETETRLQSKTLDRIVERLDVLSNHRTA